MASFLPLYLRNYYGNEPLFENSKIVTSVYNQGFNGTLNAEVSNKIKFDAIDDQALTHLDNPTFENVMKVAINNSDAVIIGSEDISNGRHGTRIFRILSNKSIRAVTCF